MNRATPDMSDEELVAKTLGDQVFFREIVDRYETPLGRYVCRLGVRVREDQEDVLQEIFIKVYRNLNNFDNSFSFSAWIYRIAHNEAISWYRKKNVRPEGHLVDDEDELIMQHIIADGDDAEQNFDKTVNAGELSRAIRVIDQKYRDPLILRYFEHKEYDEISDILQIPVGTVGTLIHRGKKQLAKELSEEKISV